MQSTRHLGKRPYPSGWVDSWCGGAVFDMCSDDGTWEPAEADCLECLDAVQKFATDCWFRVLDIKNERAKEDEANYRRE